MTMFTPHRSPWVTRALDEDLPPKSYDTYAPPSREDYCSMPLFHDGPCDSPLAHSPDEELPFDPAYYSDGSRV